MIISSEEHPEKTRSPTYVILDGSVVVSSEEYAEKKPRPRDVIIDGRVMC